MTKQAALKQLETIIGKLSHLQYHIEGSTSLQEATRYVASTRDRLQSGQIKVKKH